MKTSDVGSSIFLMATGGFMAWQADKLSLGSFRRPGPGFFPFWVGLLLTGMAVVILVQAVKGKPGVSEPGSSKSKVILALVAIFVYAFVLEPVGYLLSTFFLMFLLLKMMEKKVCWFAPAAACLITLISYVIFKVWLKVLLPYGLLRF